MKTGRSRAREHIVQILYQHHYQPQLSLDELLNQFESSFDSDKVLKDFVRQMVQGVLDRSEELDKVLTAHTENWRLERMPIIDRNILRMGIFELSYCKDIPHQVTLNEMVELAKGFSTEESSKFVNAVLEKVRKSLE